MFRRWCNWNNFNDSGTSSEIGGKVMELNKENVKKIMKIVAFGIVLYFVLQNLTTLGSLIGKIINILSPFLFGAAFAFVLNIPMKFLEKRLFKPKKLKNGTIKKSKAKRPICIFLSVVFLILIIAIVIKLVIPQLISVIVMFLQDVPSLAYNIKEWAIDLTKQYPDISNRIQGIEINWEKLVNDIISWLGSFAGNLMTSSIEFVSSLIGGIFDSIVAIIFAIYILMSKESLKEQAKKVICAYFSKERAEYILEIAKLSKNTFYNFITGQCTEAVILGSLCFVGMLILRLPFAATISILVGVMALIPIVGAFIAVIIGAILILSVSPIKSVIFIVFFLLLQQFEGNVIYPRVVGSSVGLPGMWVLVAVVVGGSLGGVLGLLIGLPTISVLYTIFKNDVNRRWEAKSEWEEET